MKAKQADVNIVASAVRLKLTAGVIKESAKQMLKDSKQIVQKVVQDYTKLDALTTNYENVVSDIGKLKLDLMSLEESSDKRMDRIVLDRSEEYTRLNRRIEALERRLNGVQDPAFTRYASDSA